METSNFGALDLDTPASSVVFTYSFQCKNKTTIVKAVIFLLHSANN